MRVSASLCCVVPLALAAAPPMAGRRWLQQGVSCGGGADLNHSGSVDVADLLLALGAFGRSAADPAIASFDLSGNGSIDVADLLLVLGAFGQVCEGMVDVCGCGGGEGWSSSAGACVDGAHTSNLEANECSLDVPAPNAEQACSRLSEQGLDCAACLMALPEEPACPQWSAAQDRAAERTALFPNGVKRLYNQTDWLWEEEAPIRRVEVEMSDSNWAALIGNPSAEEYYEGTVSLVQGGEVLGTWQGVGVRFKGSVGSLGSCFRGSNARWDAGGPCNKLSMKLKFNFVDSSQRFFGLKKVMLHASMGDNSQLRERLGYSLFREMGVPTSRQQPIDVLVNTPSHLRDGPMGLHLLTENPDGRFTEAYFPGGDGNLYKQAWPGLVGPDAARRYASLLVTNEETASTDRMMNFTDALSSATTDWDLAQVMWEYMDVEQVAMYWAVDRALGLNDGPVHFRWFRGRCSDGTSDAGFFNHNYFLYQTSDRAHDRFHIVPWDMDNAMKGSMGVSRWDQPVCSSNYHDTGRCAHCAFDPARLGGFGDAHLGPSCWKMIRAYTRALRSLYIDAAERLLEGPLQRCRLQRKLDAWSAQIAPFIASDVSHSPPRYPPKSGWGQPQGLQTWHDAVAELRRNIESHVAAFKRMVSCSDDHAADVEAWDPHVSDPESAHIVRFPRSNPAGALFGR